MHQYILGFGILLCVVAAVVLGLAPLGPQLGWWTFREGFTLLRWSGYIGLAAAAIALLGTLLTRRWVIGLAAVIGALAVAAMPWTWQRTARSAPPIHDITTDTLDPPAFVAILPLRAGSPNKADYEGAPVANQQRRAYPDIQPLILPLDQSAAFSRALEAARAMGWEIVASSPREGRIEATATTFWFGFKDDVVVRVRQALNGSRIDVRSTSRVGRGDVGTNARRIRAYLERLRKAA
jgi:uncharacterized protein (DUF1499 family)